MCLPFVLKGNRRKLNKNILQQTGCCDYKVAAAGAAACAVDVEFEARVIFLL